MFTLSRLMPVYTMLREVAAKLAAGLYSHALLWYIGMHVLYRDIVTITQAVCFGKPVPWLSNLHVYLVRGTLLQERNLLKIGM